MTLTTEHLLTELEAVTNRMAEERGLSLDDLTALTKVRADLVRQWMESPSSEPAAVKRLGSIVRRGAEAENRLKAMRQSCRDEMAKTERIRCLARELRGMAGAPPHALNVRV